MFRWLSCAVVLSFALVQQAWCTTVSMAGFAYAGGADFAKRFPYSERIQPQFGAGGINALIRQAVAAKAPKGIELDSSSLSELKGRDQVVTVALVMTGETVSSERFGSLTKVFVQLRAQAMFFDFKSMTVLRAYPFSVAYVDLLDHSPSGNEIAARVRALYLGEGATAGIVGRFVDALDKASLPAQVPRFLQVSQATVSDEVRQLLPAALTNAPAAAETWVADMLAEAISSRAGVPILPYAKGYAIGKVMSMRIADSTVFELKLPEPDYPILADLRRFGRFEHGRSAAGTSYIYASKARVALQRPMGGSFYLDAEFKNGEVKVVPESQRSVDDFPAYTDSLRGLFSKLADAMAGADSAWLRDATASSDIDKQISATREVLKSCK